MTSTYPYLWKIGAPAGYGIMTTGLAMTKLASRAGLTAFDYSEYPSLVRGGHNTYEVCISDTQRHATKTPIDCLVCLNAETFELHKHRLHEESLVVFDPSVFTPSETAATLVEVPFQHLLNTMGAFKYMTNMVALGASLALLGSELQPLLDMIADNFKRKGMQIVARNQACARAGYQHVTSNHQQHCKSIFPEGDTNTQDQIVLSGNEAFSLGAAAADCRYYGAYPMTPASSVLTHLAAWEKTTQMIVRHNEDEVAVINNALGASHAGVRAAVGTSGGGFALMTEAISYAGVAEIPIVLFLAMRPGPATGLPTWTEQGDLLFAVHAGHGEFPKIVLAAGDMAEMLELTKKAFDLAEIYQTPVIVLSDKHLSESHSTLSRAEADQLLSTPIERGKTVTEPSASPYLRYQLTDDGISPRLVPGHPGEYYQANSYEHLEDSHTTEDADVRVAQVDKRARKQTTYFNNHFTAPQVTGDLDTANATLVSWGSNKGAIEVAQQQLEEQGITTAYIHFTHLYPLDAEVLKPLFEHQTKYILIENNATAQLGQLLRQHTGIDIMKHTVLKYDGRPFWPEELVEKVVSVSN